MKNLFVLLGALILLVIVPSTLGFFPANVFGFIAIALAIFTIFVFWVAYIRL